VHLGRLGTGLYAQTHKCARLRGVHPEQARKRELVTRRLGADRTSLNG
jgi:hypothetical protein